MVLCAKLYSSKISHLYCTVVRQSYNDIPRDLFFIIVLNICAKTCIAQFEKAHLQIRVKKKSFCAKSRGKQLYLFKKINFALYTMHRFLKILLFCV